MISHVSLGTNDIDRARAFYDAVLGTIGLKQVMSFEGAVAYGGEFPEFWVQKPVDGTRPAAAGNGTHIAFGAKSRAGVRAFHASALAAGGEDAGAPGPRPQYGDKYYGAFVIDPDGHKIEAEMLGSFVRAPRVRSWLKADSTPVRAEVRFTPRSGHRSPPQTAAIWGR